MAPIRSAVLARCSRICLLAALLLFVPLFPADPSGASAAADDSRQCLACHDAPGMVMTFGDGSRLPVSVDGRRFASSVHGSAGCSGCHPAVDPNAHPSAPPASKREYRKQQAATCRNCHPDDRLRAHPQHRSVLGMADAPLCTTCHGAHGIVRPAARKGRGTDSQYCLSCHARPLTKKINGETVSLTIGEGWLGDSVHNRHECTDCHTSYGKDQHPSSTGLASKRDLSHESSRACERCHFEKGVQHRDSIHRVLLDRGERRAPGCSDCHGAHRVGPGALTDTLEGTPCGKCHREIHDAYRSSVHGMSKRLGIAGAPLCAGCHRAHDVKAARASLSPRARCLSCHPKYEEGHRLRLPNPQAHLEMVACTACHVPAVYRRSIYLRLADPGTGALIPEAEVRKLLPHTGAAGSLPGPRALWNLYTDLRAVRPVEVGVAVGIDEHRNAHYLAPRDIAVKQCESCHSADSSFFQSVSIAVAGPDGREILIAADPAVLHSAYGMLLLKRFYVMSGTRVTAMDWAGAAIVLAGAAVPVVHGSLRLLTAGLRRRRQGGPGKGGGR